MAEVDYFLKPSSWKVLTDAGSLLDKILPGKGSTIKIERQAAGSPKICIVALEGATPRVVLKDFKFQKGKGRLELTPPKADYMLVIEEVKANGRPRLRARAEPIQPMKPPALPVRKLPQKDMTGTWGAEANPTGGGRT